ncbi:A/G-specific adenine glycosylase [Sphingobacterium corticibacter]|uniref:Adenine DNA glycosylase n=1 Tax=Sphingobacterium corticibacter TaxID=2171749 RepID=A0A2T8HJD2_9SPHI|nr:A/G-specific adenine glycosylase [Sphingobacterium corticibacter]PVH25554.1 A/G-specific adenine glycosylase [Sphingobacterium corticibacter]
MSFSSKLIAWYEKYGRELPWRQTSDPYIIWLSEIILQQTRVEQGLPYFQTFVTQLPTVRDFAEAEEDFILRLWQGLGYYSRARNMHKAAKTVMSNFNGAFPTSYEEVIQLPGIGAYTASAISSFSSNEVRAVVDGNVYRVLSRVFGIDTDINSGTGKKQFQELADSLISTSQPGLYNQAIMDFGATVCKPKQPLCAACIFADQCDAFATNRVDLLPRKVKTTKIRKRYFHYFIIRRGAEIMVAKRPQGDIWANLYEFPMLETTAPILVEELQNSDAYIAHFDSATPIPLGVPIKQVLSHQHIYAQFYLLPENTQIKNKKTDWEYILSDNLDKLAKHKLIFSFLRTDNFPN